MKTPHGLLGLFCVLSVFLHLCVLLAELLQQWLWMPEQEMLELRETSRVLHKQEIGPAALAGVNPADSLTVFLGRPAPSVPVRLQPTARLKSSPRPRPTVTPLPVTENVADVSPLIEPLVEEPAEQPVSSQLAIAPTAPPVVPTQTPAPAAESVARFPAEVKITYRWGLYVADMVWKVQNGRYDVVVEGSGLGAFYRYFHSRGRLDARGVWPDHFIEYRERSHTRPEFQLDFDHETRMVEMGAPGKRRMEEMGADDRDVFAAAFHLALMGSAQEEYVMTVYTGRRRYENVHFKIAGEATLSFGEQKIDAVLLRGQWENRRFDFWLAPEWNNLPIRMNIVVPDRGSFDLWAQDLTIDGKTVLEWTPPQTE